MRFQHILPVQFLVSSSLAVNLYAASYAGQISTLQLSHSSSGYSLTTIASTRGSAPQPSWLEFHPTNNLLYAVNENWGGINGSIAAYAPQKDGSLSLVGIQNTLGGPVSESFYNGGKAVAIGNYGSSSVQTLAIDKAGALSVLQTFQWKLSAPGPNPSRQDAPHPHQVLLDPTGGYIVVPDLGADLIRIFSVDTRTSLLAELPPFSAPPGSGPRHVAFLKTPSGTTYLFLVTELNNVVTSYRVVYGRNGKSLSLVEVFKSGMWGSDPVPAGSSAAEVIISPDNKFLLTSSRNNALPTGSDTLQTWSINHLTGALTFKQLSPSGGLTPRHFSLNKAGSLVAVGAQGSGRVVIFSRDANSGVIGKEVARVEGLGGVNTVVWDE